MADGVKGAITQIPKDVTEAAIEPVKDEVGKMIETGVQSVTGNYPDPVNSRKKGRKK